MTTMRSAMVIASTWSCVTYTVVVFRRWCSELISALLLELQPPSPQLANAYAQLAGYLSFGLLAHCGLANRFRL
jgi:hypothetical protein